jgi:putative tributyrin esterase
MAPTEPAIGVRTIAVSDRQFEYAGVRFLTLYSPALGGRGDVSVFSPSGLRSCVSAPIIILLHGVYASHWAWFFKGGAHEVAAKLIATSQIRPMLLVAPSDGLYEDGSAYLRHSGRDYEQWITADLLEGIVKTVACVSSSSPVFIAGLSMGGYGALRLGAKRPDIFRGISAHSAITRIEEMSQFTPAPFPPEEIGTGEADVVSWMETNRDRLPPLRFDCGSEDPLIEGNRRFHLELKRRKIPHRYLEFEGGHDWSYWHKHVSSSLLFFEEILREAAKPSGRPTLRFPANEI